MKKIAFCTTCMNRTHHLKETYIQNIKDNFLPESVEFVLLDYNSTDGLEEWVKGLSEYIDRGVLNCYKTPTPAHYKRSHSRNMAFRLADADIICNLDADNYLGKGFASHVINLFKDRDKIFYTPTYGMRDVIGRLCVKRKDFMHIRGYNEKMEGYGFEDIEMYARLVKSGLEQKFIDNTEFNRAIRHPHQERLSEESLNRHLLNIYMHHINPYTNEILLLNDDCTCKLGVIKDYRHIHDNISDIPADINLRMLHDGFAVTLIDGWHSGIWNECDDEISICISDKTMVFGKDVDKVISGSAIFYRFDNPETRIPLLLLLSEITNRKIANDYLTKSTSVNPDEIGTGIVFKNFNYDQEILLT